MFSVTSDPATNAAFQGAPTPKSGRSDPSPGNDSFADLVDNGAATDGNNARAEAHAASQRRADDAAATAADNRRSRDAAAADRAARNDSDDRDATTRRRADDAADAPHSRAKPGSSKAAPAKPTEKRASDRTSTTDSANDPTAPAQQDRPATTTPDPVAVPLATTTASTDTPAAAPASGNATAPLAIAAAAIAASVSVAAALGQRNTDPDAATPAAANALDAGAAETDAQAAAAVVIAASGEPASQADASSKTDAALAAAGPGAPKPATPLKAQAARTGTAASDDSGAAPDAADPAATATSTGSPAGNVAQPATASKVKAGHGAVDAAKVEGSASTSAAGTAGHTHPELAPAGQAPIDSSNPALPAAGTIQPHLHSTAATASATALTAAAATNDAVPLSGLAVEIAARARSGNTHFEIRLDPADLGRIDVRIDVDRHGHVTSHLMVEKPETLSMLRQDSPQLQRALDDAGFRTGDGGLQFSLRDQSSSGQNNDSGSGRNAHRLTVGEDDSIPAVSAGRTYGRMLGSSSGVDIRV